MSKTFAERFKGKVNQFDQNGFKGVMQYSKNPIQPVEQHRQTNSANYENIKRNYLNFQQQVYQAQQQTQLQVPQNYQQFQYQFPQQFQNNQLTPMNYMTQQQQFMTMQNYQQQHFNLKNDQTIYNTTNKENNFQGRKDYYNSLYNQKLKQPQSAKLYSENCLGKYPMNNSINKSSKKNYSAKEYNQCLKRQNFNFGGLGPNFNQKWQKGKKKLNKTKQYSEMIRNLNMQHKPKKEVHKEQKKNQSKREKAMQYAQYIPKPKKKVKELQKKQKQKEKELEDIDKHLEFLEQHHQMYKKKLEEIQPQYLYQLITKKLFLFQYFYNEFFLQILQ